MTNLINEQANQEIDNFLAQWKEKQKEHSAFLYKYWSEQSYKDMSYDEKRQYSTWKETLSHRIGFCLKVANESPSSDFYADMPHSEQYSRQCAEEVEFELNKQVAIRKQKLINAIINKGGKIIKVLHMRFDIDLDGAFECEKGTVTLNTIGAGGYNIQCYHYRTLIKLKK